MLNYRFRPIAVMRKEGQHTLMWLWLAFGAAIVIPFALRLSLIQRWKVRRWIANLTAISFLPAVALAACVISISTMTQQEKTDAGMAMIFPLFLVGAPLVASVIAVAIAEFMEHVG